MTISHFVPRTVRACLLLSGVVLLAACEDTNRPPPVEFRIPVEVAEVSTSNVEDLISTTGTLRTRALVSLQVETPGRLEIARDSNGERLVEGSVVKSGQLIAETTGEDARLAARLAATRQNLEAYRQELSRREQLFGDELIAEEEMSRTRANYENALHDYESSVRTNALARSTTPIDGVVLYLARTNDGQPIADGQKVNAGLEVARIAPMDTLIADLDLVSPELAKVRPGQPVRIRHYAFDGVSMIGRVLRLSPTLDPGTHTFRVEVEVDNPGRLLKPGMFVQASIIVERREDVIVVPREAVTQRAGRSVVFSIDGQRARRRFVTLGLGSDDIVEVTDGIARTDRIVIRGLETLTNDTRVREITL
ncbi:MAG: hypothetical protein CMQ05_13370 [Gammaproteobacteria bacterium]|nr:hypothetical protein [Gammaproteobacteria bacterium]RPG26991.1 MAG: efflux RND transporter periplasmic adaptor subunit [Gammaproteobacteria bacterium TMED50]